MFTVIAMRAGKLKLCKIQMLRRDCVNARIKRQVFWRHKAFFGKEEVCFMEKTINGKTYGVFLEEFLSPLPAGAARKREDGYYYFPYDCYEERLVKTAGFFNFEIYCGKAKVEVIGEKAVISKMGSLVIYNDNHEVAKKVTVGAGEAVMFSVKNQSIINFGNTQKKLDRDILVNAMQALGVGRKELNVFNKRQAHAHTGKKTAANAKPETNIYEIEFKNKLCPMEYGYKSEVIVSGKAYEMVIFQDGIKEIERRMKIGDFCIQAKPPIKLRIKGHYQKYQGRMQLVMTSFA